MTHKSMVFALMFPGGFFNIRKENEHTIWEWFLPVCGDLTRRLSQGPCSNKCGLRGCRWGAMRTQKLHKPFCSTVFPGGYTEEALSKTFSNSILIYSLEND